MNKGRFQRGKSGNPGGRPKVLGEIQELARQQATKALDVLVQNHAGRDGATGRACRGRR